MSADGSDGARVPDNAGDGPNAPPQEFGFKRVLDHMGANKIEAALWITRMLTFVFCVSFMLPILGGDPVSHYQKALISSAVTSALRLHQRLPNFQFSREYLSRLFIEDSAHYLFYSLIFINSYPVTLALVPAFLFAILHSGNYTKQLLNLLGQGSVQFLRNMVTKLETNQVSMLRFIACSEIFMMPVIIVMMFVGRISLLLPFVYYRFLTLRYASRRNPYCRQLFYELRIVAHQLSNHPSCPGIVRTVTEKMVAFISRLAPPIQEA